MEATVRPGLDEVIASQTEISSIDGEAGKLFYRGYSIDDLGRNATFEEVCWLLWRGNLPRRAELEEISRHLRAQRKLPGLVLDTLRALARKARPMEALRTAVSLLSVDRSDRDDTSREANLSKAIHLTARFPTIVAAFDRLRRGQEPLDPDDSLGHAANFLYMLNGRRPSEAAARMFDACLVLHADHGLNASTFTARVVASTLSDMHSAVTAALGALKGPLHGGANQKVMEMLLSLDGPDAAEAQVRELLAARKKVMGFGHRVYRTYDPRARHLAAFSRELAAETGEPKWYEMSRRVEQVMKEEKGLDPNVDFYSASTYYYLGVQPDLFTPIFAMSRVSGWTAHIMEQHEHNRLIRPRAQYTGPLDREWVPLDRRG